MRNVLEESCRENQNTYVQYIQQIHPPPPENQAVYEIMWENFVELDRP
jgi:hypothetical protein